MLCQRCGTPCEKRGPLQRYCDPCARECRLQTKRECEERKRRRAGIVPLGEDATCQVCASKYVRTNGQQQYCSECSEIQKIEGHRRRNRKYEASRGPRIRDSGQRRRAVARWAEKNRDKILVSVRRYNEKNRELINEKAKAFRKTSKRREWYRQWEDKKAKTDPMFVLNRRMKTAVRRGLREGKNGRSWEALVGYSVEELRNHLERQFVNGMSWVNMGQWHMDHRRPLTSFTFETAADQGFRDAWALTNLQPLCAVANVSKGGKRLFLI